MARVVCGLVQAKSNGGLAVSLAARAFFGLSLDLIVSSSSSHHPRDILTPISGSDGVTGQASPRGRDGGFRELDFMKPPVKRSPTPRGRCHVFCPTLTQRRNHLCSRYRRRAA